MCDTVVATSEATADGVTLFGKNSDRDPNEAQGVCFIPAADHSPDSTVKCTYIEIPQVAHTNTVLLSKPFWMWGAEMGVNEHNLVIGNEAVFTKVPYEKEPNSLTGMDLLRLALERAASAREAVDTITSLLETYGQGGNCGYNHPLYYHNSFLIADPKDAWVLETAGYHWAAKQVSGVYTISNAITLGDDYDLSSPDLVSYAVERGWCKDRDDFDFGRCYSDFLYTRFSDSRSRQCRTNDLLSPKNGALTVADIMQVLRDHGSQDYHPDKGIFGAQVCKHASFGPIRVDNTNGSLVSNLHPNHPTHFITGTAAPCTGIFKPVWVDTPITDFDPQPTGTFDEAALFWRHEALHRTILRDFQHRLSLIQPERDELETRFIKGALALAGVASDERAAFASQCFAEAGQALARWRERQAEAEDRSSRSWLHKIAWDSANRQAEVPV
jgi:secernin